MILSHSPEIVAPQLGEMFETIERNLSGNHLAHTLLFSGQEGGGQLFMALQTAATILANQAKNGDVETARKKALQLIHPDLHLSFPVIGAKKTSEEFLVEFRNAVNENPFIDLQEWLRMLNAENKLPNITREEAHRIIKRLGLKPFESKARVVVLWLPEYLGATGNTLLKILEEPPTDTYFILVTNRPENIIATVLSRCQLVKVPCFSIDELKHIFGLFEMPDELPDELLFAAEGNVSELKRGRNTDQNQFTGTFRNWMLGCFTQNLHQVVPINEEIARLKKDAIMAFLKTGLRVVHECVSVRLNPASTIAFPIEHHDFIRKLSKAVKEEHIPEINSLFNHHIYQIERNLNPKIVLLNLAFEISSVFQDQG